MAKNYLNWVIDIFNKYFYLKNWYKMHLIIKCILVMEFKTSLKLLEK